MHTHKSHSIFWINLCTLIVTFNLLDKLMSHPVVVVDIVPVGYHPIIIIVAALVPAVIVVAALVPVFVVAALVTMGHPVVAAAAVLRVASMSALYPNVG